MSKKMIRVSRESIEASQKKLEEMMSKDPHGKEELEELAKLEKSLKELEGGETK